MPSPGRPVRIPVHLLRRAGRARRFVEHVPWLLSTGRLTAATVIRYAVAIGLDAIERGNRPPPGAETDTFQCPYCEQVYVHVVHVDVVQGTAVTLHLFCEDGHRWMSRYHPHKGMLYVEHIRMSDLPSKGREATGELEWPHCWGEGA